VPPNLCGKATVMLSTISWGQFLYFLLGCLAGYYAVLWWKYYRTSLLNWWKAKRVRSIPEQDSSRIELEDQFAAANQCANRIRGLLDGPETNQTEADMLASLQQLLQDYGWLKGTPFQVAINNLLMYGFEQRFDRPLEENELELCWIG
jgi:hypothetical protein